MQITRPVPMFSNPIADVQRKASANAVSQKSLPDSFSSRPRFGEGGVGIDDKDVMAATADPKLSALRDIADVLRQGEAALAEQIRHRNSQSKRLYSPLYADYDKDPTRLFLKAAALQAKILPANDPALLESIDKAIQGATAPEEQALRLALHDYLFEVKHDRLWEKADLSNFIIGKTYNDDPWQSAVALSYLTEYLEARHGKDTAKLVDETFPQGSVLARMSTAASKLGGSYQRAAVELAQRNQQLHERYYPQNKTRLGDAYAFVAEQQMEYLAQGYFENRAAKKEVAQGAEQNLKKALELYLSERLAKGDKHPYGPEGAYQLDLGKLYQRTGQLGKFLLWVTHIR